MRKLITCFGALLLALVVIHEVEARPACPKTNQWTIDDLLAEKPEEIVLFTERSEELAKEISGLPEISQPDIAKFMRQVRRPHLWVFENKKTTAFVFVFGYMEGETGCAIYRNVSVQKDTALHILALREL